MAIQRGEDVILKVGDGEAPTEAFIDLGGLVNTSLQLVSDIIESTDLSSGAYRQVNDQTGIKKLVIKAEGFFSDVLSEELLRGYAFSGASSNYELHFGNGDKISGAFVISSYGRRGNLEAQEDFIVILESSSNVSFTKGA